MNLRSGFPLLLQQFTALLTKNLWLSWRNRRASLLQLLSPLFFIFLIFVIDKAIQARQSSSTADKSVTDPRLEPSPPITPCEQKFFIKLPCYDFVWSGNGNPKFQTIVDRIMANNPGRSIPSTKVKSFRNPTEVDDWLFNNPMRCPGALHFTERNATVIGYGVQTNSTFLQIRGRYEDPTTAFQLPLQLAAEREIARYLIGAPNFSWNVSFKEFAHPAMETFAALDSIGPAFFLAIAMFNFVLQMSSLVTEKENKLRQTMAMMGLYDTAYWISWLTWEAIIALLSSLLIVLFGMMFQFDFFLENSFGILFFVFFLFELSMTGFAFMLSAFIRKSSSATTAGFSIFIVGFVTQIVVQGGFPYDTDVSKTIRNVWSLFPPNPFAQALHLLSDATSTPEDNGISWSKRGECAPNDEKCALTINDICMWLLATFFLWFILAIYFDNIIPNASGVRKSVLYFLKPSYWMGKGGDKVEEGGVCSCVGSVPPPEYIEPDDEDVLEEENIVKQQARESVVDPNVAVQIRGLAKTYPGAFNIGCCCKCKRTTPYNAVKGLWVSGFLAMATKKVIAICQSGGEFVTNKDGSLSYNGGEAYAIDIDQQTQLSDLKSEAAEMFNCNVDTMIVKYFLPGNKKTLITISKDKDLQRMVNFLGDAATVDVFIMSEEAAARNTSNMPGSRSSRTTVSEAVVPVVLPVDLPVDMVHPLVEIEVDVANEAPLSCVPAVTYDDKHHKAAQQWENTITGVDQRFNSFSEFREALHKYSIAHGFAYRYKKNDSHRVTVKCKSQGCPWRIYASRLSTTQLICIKKMNTKHTCEGAAVKAGYRATRGWVGSIIKEKLKVSPNYKPKDIADDIKREYGIQLNYSQAWRAKEIAREQLQGSYKEAYTQLPFFCEKIKETNPGSFATFTTKEDSSFHRLFVSFHASLSGFQQGCRPLLFLDSTPLNSKYQGELLAATAADGNDGIFPVAFAVVDAETEDNWHWFLQELKSALSTSEQITFVADFQNGLKKSLAEIFEKCYHSYCLRHLAEKLNKDLKGQFSHEARRFMVNDFYAAAYAPKLEAFDRSIENIKGISPEAYNWVIQSEPEHWANAFFGGARYNNLTSNFGQQFYSWVSEAHELPITQMIDVLRGKMMETIYTRRVESNHWLTKLTPSKEEMLQNETSVARSLQVLLSQGSTFEVRGESVDIVDIDHWDCSCKGWQITGLPCCHAIAVFECVGRSPYDYCSRYFTVENYQLTYAESIHPVPNVDRPVQVESTLAVTVTPPPTKRPPGRPKMKQVESIDIIKRQLQCSKCKGLGHNKKTCKLL